MILEQRYADNMSAVTTYYRIKYSNYPSVVKDFLFFKGFFLIKHSLDRFKIIKTNFFFIFHYKNTSYIFNPKRSKNSKNRISFAIMFKNKTIFASNQKL